jgi:P27 family predicted phage terminase small subunit
MGKRGPAPKPTSLRILHGDQKTRINDSIKPIPGMPEAPDEMSFEAQDVWYYTLRQLKHMKIISQADRDALACYCEAVAMHRKASAQLAKQELIVESQTGTPMKNPLIQVVRDSAAQMKAFAGEFGLTPRARSEIKVEKTDERDDRERLLS